MAEIEIDQLALVSEKGVVHFPKFALKGGGLGGGGGDAGAGVDRTAGEMAEDDAELVAEAGF
jgi:hypothetical protein